MCGRFTLHSGGEVVAEAFGLSEVPQLQPRFNITPLHPVAVVRFGNGQSGRELVLLRWGLIWLDASLGRRPELYPFGISPLLPRWAVQDQLRPAAVAIRCDSPVSRRADDHLGLVLVELGLGDLDCLSEISIRQLGTVFWSQVAGIFSSQFKNTYWQ
jgi:hypothetical protein